eukprot:TRINITY_DN93124_c0_g1_i1.p1 TRINITY_DN93124_c0_g1~~TRINITY_DN93124_c0_g1_i1.p1  ORF type:complete len:177 (-),score=18.55 TRINITY_DN93124_c0_g1_i1:103-633(-)
MAMSSWEPQDAPLVAEQECESEEGKVPAGHRTAWRVAAKASAAVVCLLALAVIAYISLPHNHSSLVADIPRQNELISLAASNCFTSQGADTTCVPDTTLDYALQEKSGQYTYHRTSQDCMYECLKFGFGASVGKCFGYTTFDDESTCIVWITPLETAATETGTVCMQTTSSCIASR